MPSNLGTTTTNLIYRYHLDKGAYIQAHRGLLGVTCAPLLPCKGVFFKPEVGTTKKTDGVLWRAKSAEMNELIIKHIMK